MFCHAVEDTTYRKFEHLGNTNGGFEMEPKSDLGYVQNKITRVSGTFIRNPEIKRQDILIADTVENACLYRIGYCQDVQEIRADYNEYVYDNSFARRRRRNR